MCLFFQRRQIDQFKSKCPILNSVCSRNDSFPAFEVIPAKLHTWTWTYLRIGEFRKGAHPLEFQNYVKRSRKGENYPKFGIPSSFFFLLNPLTMGIMAIKYVFRDQLRGGGCEAPTLEVFSPFSTFSTKQSPPPEYAIDGDSDKVFGCIAVA